MIWEISDSLYAYSHLSKRHNIVGVLRNVPIPGQAPPVQLTQLVREYTARAKAEASEEELAERMLNIDALVLSLYNLPPEVEQELLSTFDGEERLGVPFTQTRYFPEEFQYPLSFHKFREYEADWRKTNRRRGALIKKESQGTLTADERQELEGLQAYADYYLDREVPPDYSKLDELIRQQVSRRSDTEGTT